MKWLDKLLGGKPNAGAEALLDFIYIRIPGDQQPVERHYLFEDPIDEQLKRRNLGYVSGGGTMQSPPDADGNQSIEYTGVDVEAENIDAVRALLRDLLPQLGTPTGTQVEFTVGSELRQDRLTTSGWITDEPRTDLHPGFDI